MNKLKKKWCKMLPTKPTKEIFTIFLVEKRS